MNLLPKNWQCIFMTSVSLLPHPTKCYDGNNFDKVGQTYREANPDKSSLKTFPEATFGLVSSNASPLRVSISSYIGVVRNLGTADVCGGAPMIQ